ncbi:MAG: alpha/beta hydrolase [Pseudomonadota bacterium]
MRSALLGFIGLLVVGYAAIVALVTLFQDRLLYFPAADLVSTPADAGYTFEDVWLDTADGDRIHGWYIPAAAPTNRTVLFLHGNAGNISHRMETIYHWHTLGLNCLIIDYRGYGLSGGKPGEAETREDALAAFKFLTGERGIGADAIVLHGRSLGGAVALSVLDAVTPGAVIIESTFTSLPDIGAEQYPWLPVRLMSRIQYSSLARVRELTVPLMIMHSNEDRLIPFHHGRALYDAAPQPKRFFEMRGGHNSGFAETGPAYIQALREFVTEHLARDELALAATPGKAVHNARSESSAGPARQ